MGNIQFSEDGCRVIILDQSLLPGEEKYIELEEFYYKVNDRVIYAVNLYLAYPEYFNEGYYQFRGDGTWNYFWGDN